MNTLLWVFAAYLLVMLAIGYGAFRRTSDLPDYVLGGRRLGRWVAALSAGASDMSGWLLLGLPGYAYVSGLEAGWLVLGLWLGTYANWRFVAERLRRYSRLSGRALTLPEFFERRFRDRSRLLRLVSAVFILLFFAFYASSGLVAGGRLFETVFGLPYLWAVTAGTLVIVSYTFIGGFLAVSWTDLVQGLLMAAALVAAPLAAIHALGGLTMTWEAMESINPYLSHPWLDKSGEPIGLLAIVSLLGWGLGYFGQPHILARFKAIRSANEVPAARRIAMTWVTISMAGALFVGIAGIGFIQPPLVGADAEKVFIKLVEALFHPIPAGLCLAAILAAIMSTADSQLLVASSVLTEDFYKTLLRPRAPTQELMLVGRTTVAAIALVAFWLAQDPDSKILDLVAYAWAGFGAAFGPALLFSLYWPRITRSGALAGILVGGTCVVVWKQLEGGIFDIYELVPAFLLSAGAIFLVSQRSKAPPAEVFEEFRQFRAGGRLS